MIIPLSLLCFLVGVWRPVWGLTIFLLANTGGIGFFASAGVMGSELGPLRPENLAVIGAIAALLVRSFKKSRDSVAFDKVGGWLWLLTGLMFISRVIELGSNDLVPIAKFGLSCLFLAPLYIGFKILSPEERLILRRVIIITAAFTSLLTIVLIYTGSEYLLQSLIIFKKVGKETTWLRRGLVSARITLPGFWSMVPLGLWLTISEIMQTKKLLSVRAILFESAAFLMLIAVLLNLTRSMLLAFASSLVLFIVLNRIFLNRQEMKKINLIIIICILTFTAGFGFKGLYERWQSRFGEGIQAETLQMRVGKSTYMLHILASEMPLLGHMDDDRDEVIQGDPYPFLRIWWDSGLVAAVSFFAALMAAALSLMKSLRWYRLLPINNLKAIICLAAFSLDFQMMMLSGFYLQREALFPLMFYLAEVYYFTNFVPSYTTQGNSDQVHSSSSQPILLRTDHF